MSGSVMTVTHSAPSVYHPVLEKASTPMLVTLSGMVMEVRPLQPEKAWSPMLVTLFGMIVFLQPAIKVFVAVSIIALQSLRESYIVFPVSTLIEVRPLQPLKTSCPMSNTLFGMVTEVRPVQSRKADSPILVTL